MPEQQLSSSRKHPVDYLRCCDLRTLKDVKLFTRHGGPDLSGLRNSRQQGLVNPPSTEPTTNTIKIKSTGDLKCILAQPRPSLSPSKFADEEHERFARADAHAAKEKQVSELVIPITEGKIADARCHSGGIPFTNLIPLTDGTLKPGTQTLFPTTMPIPLRRFICGKGEPVSDNNAYTTTSIYHDGQLKMYTSHPAQPTSAGGGPEYYVTQLNTWGITGNPESFRQGATAYRNARDWAKEQIDKAIQQANERANPPYGKRRNTDVSGAEESWSKREEMEVVDIGNRRTPLNDELRHNATLSKAEKAVQKKIGTEHARRRRS
ncbi:uncharacterized protein BDZ99DRAFT_490458 [Mytilinidion resinicola]|uniref:Uncharacterized protein n=1 Tax=Mytilinidion resinicola TaxID=574789 RepID=A0A6A6YBP9_9PEZI|nr:uncharacterized protein BDZ99DRAFT_490458 [Mytilinidion resinicola]KAF2806039.1 hypothetical protein BDZ99DRAFT_490458 [Mytilinidion resinicola]